MFCNFKCLPAGNLDVDNLEEEFNVVLASSSHRRSDEFFAARDDLGKALILGQVNVSRYLCHESYFFFFEYATKAIFSVIPRFKPKLLLGIIPYEEQIITESVGCKFFGYI